MNLITVGNSLVEKGRAEVCVNAMRNKANPEAWVNAAERVEEYSLKPGFSQELAEALLDMKKAEVGE